MDNQYIDAKTLARMFLSGAKALDEKKEWINELNVFPVPDGDTGTNMTMTMMSAAKELSETDGEDMAKVCKAISQGSLRGARGNSGVILSQLLRGFTKGAREHEKLDVALLTECLDKAVETAYKAVMKPKEGTILTVAKGAFRKAQELSGAGEKDLKTFLTEVLSYTEEVLAQTPEMLPVLKEAGVVDSGGQGLVEAMKGALAAFLDRDADVSIGEVAPAEGRGVYASGKASKLSTADIKFLYCTEFIILMEKPFAKKQEKEFQKFLESVGDSLVLVADEDLCKVHIHSNDPGLVIQRALTYGELSNLKIDNMKMEHRERLFEINYETGDYTEIDTEISGMDAELRALNASGAPKMTPAAGAAKTEAPKEKPHKVIGFVTVCAGEGLSEIFRSIGVDEVISGGQTMNPSTADILDAVAQVNADTVFVLPNNKNIILAAEQAVKMEEKKSIRVIPTKTIPQGIAAMLGYMDGEGAEENEASMREAFGAIASGEVTYAIRDTEIEGRQIHEGDFMGIGDEGILSSGKDCAAVVCEMLDALVNEESALISIYYGKDTPKEQAEEIRDALANAYADVDIELSYGGQPVYYYILSVE
ncbi:MAG: DAK2 domain-containing protein [Lachnospiraceae bacterium]|nr:DAK2 domain-containing protein [Lachnospiraceae bacterium]